MSNIQNEIINVIRQVYDGDLPEEISGDQTFFDLGLDSLDFASALMAIEDKFDLSFDEDYLEQTLTIEVVGQTVEKTLSNRK